jgi:hypothetical protein
VPPRSPIKQILHNNKYVKEILNIISRAKKEKEQKKKRITNKMGKVYICWKKN